MNMRESSVMFAIFFLMCISVAMPDEVKRSRVFEEKPMSDEEHFDNQDHHNPNYDHEAFLGEQESKAFDELSPEESKKRLGVIVDKIDTDKDGFVTHEELEKWLHKTQTSYIADDVERQWISLEPEDPEKVSWDKYRKVTYGFDSDEAADNSDGGEASYKDMMIRDKRRWDEADQDKDGLLSKAEFAAFLHPENAEHMKEIVVTETIEDIDKDKDGKISLIEYIGDMYGGDSEGEPEWVKTEREQFENFRDKNKDGFLDRSEVLAWIIPTDYNHPNAEATHLIQHSDSDKDGKLSKQEVIEHYDAFVGSQATDFGEALARHDEL